MHSAGKFNCSRSPSHSPLYSPCHTRTVESAYTMHFPTDLYCGCRSLDGGTEFTFGIIAFAVQHCGSSRATRFCLQLKLTSTSKTVCSVKLCTVTRGGSLQKEMSAMHAVLKVSTSELHVSCGQGSVDQWLALTGLETWRKKSQWQDLHFAHIYFTEIPHPSLLRILGRCSRMVNSGWGNTHSVDTRGH